MQIAEFLGIMEKLEGSTEVRVMPLPGSRPRDSPGDFFYSYGQRDPSPVKTAYLPIPAKSLPVRATSFDIRRSGLSRTLITDVVRYLSEVRLAETEGNSRASK